MTEKTKYGNVIGPGKWCGTSGGYTNHLCRCDDCRAAWAATVAKRKANRVVPPLSDPRHGSDNLYSNFGCRCRPCTDAHSARARRRRQLR